jgi:hypothetical protein
MLDSEVMQSEVAGQFMELPDKEERKRRPVSAEEVKVLADIHERDGLLKPRAVVDEARPEESPIHDRFTWDDHVAGEKYRVYEARDLIKRVVMVLPDKPEQKVPVYVSLGSDRVGDGGGYRPLPQVLSSEDLEREMLRTAYAELQSIRKRYADLKQLAGVMRAIDRALPKDEE